MSKLIPIVSVTAGCFILLWVLPKNDPNNYPPVHVASSSLKIKDGFAHAVYIRTRNLENLRPILDKYDYYQYQHYIVIRFSTETEEQYYKKVDEILEDIRTYSIDIRETTIKHVKLQ